MMKAVYRNILVKILVEYKAVNEKYAVVKAIEGKLFLSKEKMLAKTEYATVKLDELINIEPDPKSEPENLNLLDMAVAYTDRQQWYAGESVWLWRNGNKGAFLKEMDGFFVTLNLTGYQKYLIVFHLNPKTWKWEVSRNLGANYYQWIDQYKEEIP